EHSSVHFARFRRLARLGTIKWCGPRSGAPDRPRRTLNPLSRSPAGHSMHVTPPPADQGNSAVTLRITRRVRPGRHAEFEHWLDGISEAASRAPGFISINITRPRRGGRDYQAIVRFASEADLKRWEASEERAAWYARSE